MKEIESLTAEQIAKFPEYVDRWTKIGLSTEPADRPRAEAAIRWMYRNAGLADPRIVWTQSPLGNCLALQALKSGSVGARAMGSVWDNVWDSVWHSVWHSVRDSVRPNVWNSVTSNVWDSVESSVRPNVWNNVRNSIRDSFWDSVWVSVRDSVWVSVYGAHDAGWLSFYDFFAKECGMTYETDALHGLWELAKSASWVLPYENVCFVSDRHNICKLENGRIHSEVGPAIQYPDGFSIYAWRGTVIPGEWVENRTTIDPAEILKCSNVEQRAAGAAMIGWPRMVNALQRRVIDGDPDSDMGALIELTLPGLPEPGRFLQAKCPRNGTIVEGVPRVSDIDGLPIETALAAQAWRIGDPQSEYAHPPVRT
jgi:hypothetical protein